MLLAPDTRLNQMKRINSTVCKCLAALILAAAALPAAAREPTSPLVTALRPKEAEQLEALIGRIVDEKLSQRGLDDETLEKRISLGVREYLTEQKRRMREEDRRSGGQR